VKDGETVEMLMCFQCQNYNGYRQGKERPGGRIASSAQPLLDEILRDAGVPLAKKD
jgi:hypothetical protein